MASSARRHASQKNKHVVRSMSTFHWLKEKHYNLMLTFRSSSALEVLLYTLSFTVTNGLIEFTSSDLANEDATIPGFSLRHQNTRYTQHRV